MRPVITPEESGRVDEESFESVDVLMERAGLAVALEAVAMGIGYGDRVIVLAGSGNNGGDGYVAARYLARRGVSVAAHALGAPRRGDSPAATAAAGAVRAGVPVRSLGDVERADLVIDALFGVGFHGSLPAEVVPWITHPPPVLAVDVASGLDAATGIAADPSFAATRTVTFQAVKTGHVLADGPDRSGMIRVADIGLGPVEPIYRIADEVDAPLPVRLRTAHKWSVGSVLVVGGTQGITGAALLSATSALNAGSGAVGIACAEDTQPIYATAAPEILTYGVGRDVGAILALNERYDVLVVGPGLGRNPEAFVSDLLSGWNGPVVLDADGINSLENPGVLAHSRGPVVVTPHAGEFSRLVGAEASPQAAAELAVSTGAVVLLKGNPTHVCGSEHWIVDTGGPELATIGSGDVLSGMIGAFAAGGIEAEVAARSAAYHHGVTAGRLDVLRTVTARSLADAVAWKVAE